MSDCLFCRIVNQEIEATVVAANDGAVAFADIAPVAPVHVLVVPRLHVNDASELGAEHGGLLTDMFALAQAVAAAKGVDSSGYRLVMNVGKDAQCSVAHLHLHVIGGRPLAWPPG